MPLPRLFKTEALVLKSLPLGEADRLLTLYTPGLGKLRVTARGVRRPKSKLGGHLDILSRVSLSLARGRSLGVVTGAEVVESFRSLKEDLENIARGLYVAEVVEAFAPEEAPNLPLYALVVDTLRALETLDRGEVALRYFELRLLDYSGFLPELHQCVECRRPLTPGEHGYAPEMGGVVCTVCTSSHWPTLPLSVDALKVLRFFARSTPEAIYRLRLSSEVAHQIERLLGASIRFTLEREIRSSAFMAHLRRLRGGPSFTVSAPIS